jgi:hypothetical protein
MMLCSKITLLPISLTLAFGVSAKAEETDWWSRAPLLSPAEPSILESRDFARVETKIDRFIVAKHREHGLNFSPEADRRTLIRRLYFNLIGLPPTPLETASFVNDEDPTAYTKLVDRLLDSKRYGERWARHWLDVVHYGESHGYDKDKPRPNAYPYRDYVIRAFNEDKPYARFIKEQIAGDVLWPETVDGIVATGFIAAGPWDFIGHAEVPEEKIDGKVARHLDRDDMITTTMNTFCSLTVQCAQCHDHKRDPVTMKDYYSLQSVFAAVDRADRDYDPDPNAAKARAEAMKRVAATEAAIKELDAQIEAAKTDEIRTLEIEIAMLEKGLSTTGEIQGKERSGQFGYHSEIAKQQDTEKWVQVDLGKAVPIEKIALFGADEYGFADFGFPHRFRVEASTDIEFKEPQLLATHEDADVPRPGAMPVVIDGKKVVTRYVRVTATKLWSRRQKGQKPSNDWIFALGELAVISEGSTVPGNAVTALDSIEALPRWGKKDLIDGIFGRYPLADRAPDGIVAWLQEDAKAKRREVEALIAQRDAAVTAVAAEPMAEREQKSAELANHKAELEKLPKAQKVYAGTVHSGGGAFKGRGHVDGKPREIFILHRGEVTQPRDKVEPATVPGVVPGIPVKFDLPEDHKEGDRRVALAEWITHPENTLTWRSIVNRVWQYHFGRGIVDTPNDFGRIGGQPSHPELLDWLAVEFRDGGGSMKDLHRMIVNSAVYKQSSVHNSKKAEIDTFNQFLWRQNRRRLEAEAIRDTVLTASGKMNLKMYGPSFMDFVIEKPEHSPHYEYHKYDPDDETTHRRSVYRFLVRSQPQPFMDTLDCADPSQLVDKRGETITALQALAMLNNQFMVRMAEHFADRMKGELDPVGSAFELALSRKATDDERAMLDQYATEHGMAALCRLIFNLNEFSFVD